MPNLCDSNQNYYQNLIVILKKYACNKDWKMSPISKDALLKLKYKVNKDSVLKINN